MTRKLKQLGVAILAVFAVSALTASASAETLEFKSSVDHVFLDAQESSLQIMHFPEVGRLECEAVELHGTINEEDTATSEITVMPTYSGCSTKKTGEELEFDAHVKTNNCHYTLTIDEEAESINHKLNSGEYFSGPMHLDCPGENEMEIKPTFLGFKLNCIFIPEQIPTEPTVDYTVETEGETKIGINIYSTVGGIAYFAHPNCSPAGEPYEADDAEYTGEILLEGTNEKGKTVDLMIE